MNTSHNQENYSLFLSKGTTCFPKAIRKHVIRKESSFPNLRLLENEWEKLSHYLLILLVLRSVHGPQAELWIKRYHFGFVYSCPPEKTLVCPILLTLSKMRRERRMRIFGALGPDFELSNTFFKMCAKICQVATKQEITITIQNV